MLQLFIQGGLLMWPLVVVAMVLLGLAGRTARELLPGNGANTAVIENGLDGILFWGFFGAMLGVLGQIVGQYRGFSAMAKLGLASPQALWLGVAEALTSTIAGLVLLGCAGVVWFLLRWQYQRVSRVVK